MKATHVIAFILVAVGGLNWGLIGLGGFVGSDWNVVGRILGAWPTLLWIVYILVGISTVILLVTHKKSCTCCVDSGTKMDSKPMSSTM